MTINNKSGNSLLEWDLRLCWLWKRGKLCTEDVELEIVFYKIRKKAKKGKVQWNRGDLQFDLQTFWDCLNYWSHNKLSSEFFKKRETVQVFTSWCCPRRQRSLRLRSSPGFDPFSPSREGAGRFCRSGRSSSTCNKAIWKNRCRSRSEVGNWPIRRVGTVDVVVPVADPELLVEAGVVAAHVRDPPTVLVAHVEDLRKNMWKICRKKFDILGEQSNHVLIH